MMMQPFGSLTAAPGMPGTLDPQSETQPDVPVRLGGVLRKDGEPANADGISSTPIPDGSPAPYPSPLPPESKPPYPPLSLGGAIAATGPGAMNGCHQKAAGGMAKTGTAEHVQTKRPTRGRRTSQ
jgi:hypothetical protein